MRKLAALVVSTLVLGGVGVASPARADHGDGGDGDLVVLATVTDFDKDDRGDEGPSAGDRFHYRATLEDTEGEDAGKSRGGCILTDKDGHHGGGHHGHMSTQDHGDGGEDGDLVARCGAGFALDGGKLFIAGTVEKGDFKDGSVTLPIRGGSDDYEDAGGEAVIEFLHHGDHGDGGGHSHKASGFEAAGHHDGGKADHHEGPHFKVTFHFE